MSEANETSPAYPVGKAVLGVTWLLATACFFPPLDGAAIAPLGRSLFVVLAITPVIVKYNLIKLRKSGLLIPNI